MIVRDAILDAGSLVEAFVSRSLLALRRTGIGFRFLIEIKAGTKIP